jgi:hypothetical protein
LCKIKHRFTAFYYTESIAVIPSGSNKWTPHCILSPQLHVRKTQQTH